MCETKAQDSNKYPKANRWRNGPWRLYTRHPTLDFMGVCVVRRSLTFVHTLRMRKILCMLCACAKGCAVRGWKYGSASVVREGPFRPQYACVEFIAFTARGAHQWKKGTIERRACTTTGTKLQRKRNSRWKWKINGNGSTMEVEEGWKWKRDCNNRRWP